MIKLAALIAAVVIGSLAAVSVAEAYTSCTTTCSGWGSARTCYTNCF